MATQHRVSILQGRLSDREFETLLRRATEILKSSRPALPKKLSVVRKRSAPAA
jgi:hypothetical protein